MACYTQQNLTQQRKAAIAEAIDRLERAIQNGTVKAVIGANGAIAFKGLWRTDGVADTCAYRMLTARGSTALRMAIARAEVTAGRKLNPAAVASGTHSHDGGANWHAGH